MTEEAKERSKSSFGASVIGAIELAALLSAWVLAQLSWLIIGAGAWCGYLARVIGWHVFRAIIRTGTDKNPDAGRREIEHAGGYYARGFRRMHASIFANEVEGRADPLLTEPVGSQQERRWLWEVAILFVLNVSFWVPVVSSIYILSNVVNTSDQHKKRNQDLQDPPTFKGPELISYSNTLDAYVSKGTRIKEETILVACKVNADESLFECRSFPSGAYGDAVVSMLHAEGRAKPAKLGEMTVSGAEFSIILRHK